MSDCTSCGGQYATENGLCVHCIDADIEIRNRRALRPSTLGDDDERPCTHEPDGEERLR